MNENVFKHLDYIQSTITRLAQNSFAYKGWAITVVAGAFALVKDYGYDTVAFIAFFATMAFWWLDTSYTRHERLYRKLYDHVRTLPDTDLSMDTTPHLHLVDGPIRTAFSICLAGLYLPMIFIILITALVKG